ncbi:hypothetical protein [Alteromonas ponticola]|uniref:Uncharacterized protein n=1 Tax=Alteromonas ponticola TaxID=2720613 RepID=A0ABX1R0H1_9ALTE|nr:hypothetical protein [Alteromonas ponticola]NMH58705.1 hypothetical protein [Alteromonas ponticola]
MQDFRELEYKLLNQHHQEYCAFTRLLLTITVACITIMAATSTTKNWYFTISFSLLFSSLLFGILVQHRIMMTPIYHLEDAQNKMNAALKNSSSGAIEIRRKPTKLEQWFYRSQMVCFVMAFFMLALYFVDKAI